MAREDAQLKLRLPEALKASVEEAARKAGRSVNSEIVSRLTESVNETSNQAEELRAKLSELFGRYKGLIQTMQFFYGQIPEKIEKEMSIRQLRILIESAVHTTDWTGYLPNTPNELIISDQLEILEDVRILAHQFREKGSLDPDVLKMLRERQKERLPNPTPRRPRKTV